MAHIYHRQIAQAGPPGGDRFGRSAGKACEANKDGQAFRSSQAPRARVAREERHRARHLSLPCPRHH
jgi:hypothetical protein